MALSIFNNRGRKKEEAILQKIQKGDKKAFETLYKKHYRMMMRLVLRNQGTEEEGKDIYQEALILLWKKVRSGNFVLSSKISTYLYGICLNLWRKELNRKKRLSYEEQKKEFEEINDIGLENKKIVASCLSQMDEKCRKVLMYYYFDGMSMCSIAKEFGFANVDTAKTKKYKCKNKLKKLIELQYDKKDLLE